MPKLPDFSKLGKFDLQSLVDNVKSMITPGSQIPPGMEDDPMGAKLILIQAALQNLAQIQEQQQQELAKVNALLAALFKDLDALKHNTKTPPPPVD